MGVSGQELSEPVFFAGTSRQVVRRGEIGSRQGVRDCTFWSYVVLLVVWGCQEIGEQ